MNRVDINKINSTLDTFSEKVLKKISPKGAIIALLWGSILLVGWCMNKNIPSFFTNIHRALLFIIAVLLSYSEYILEKKYYVNFSKVGIYEKTKQDLVPLAMLVLQIAMSIVSPYSDATGFLKLPEGLHIRTIGLILFIIGFTITALSYKSLGENFSINVTILDDQKLIKTGIYSKIRHPWYLGTIVTSMVIPLVFLSIAGLFFSIIISALMIWRAGREEKLLESEFGEEWQTYTKKTKKFIPFLF